MIKKYKYYIGGFVALAAYYFNSDNSKVTIEYPYKIFENK